jgi:uncharacterized protein YlaN (UPF0358 family)
MGMHAGFERLLAELNFELWIGDAQRDRQEARTQVEDGSADAQHILQFLKKFLTPRVVLCLPFPISCLESRIWGLLRELLNARSSLLQIRDSGDTIMKSFEKCLKLIHCGPWLALLLLSGLPQSLAQSSESRLREPLRLTVAPHTSSRIAMKTLPKAVCALHVDGDISRSFKTVLR